MTGAGDGMAVILLYHRVAEPASDPFQLSVTPRQFGEHLEFLETLGPVERLSDIGGRELSFAITFDDGYADNLHAAKPILERHGAPATVFVTTGTVGGRRFWWDELGQLVLESDALPEVVALELDGVRTEWHPAEDGRDKVHHEIWASLQPLDDEARSAALDAVRAQFPAPAADEGRTLTRDELADLAADGLVEVGAHTQTHPVLSALPDGRASEEITGSKAWLEDVLDRAVTAFSYPFGGSQHYGSREVELVRGAGFDLACSAEAGVVDARSDRLQLARVTVGNWDVEVLEKAVMRVVRTARRERS